MILSQNFRIYVNWAKHSIALNERNSAWNLIAGVSYADEICSRFFRIIRERVLSFSDNSVKICIVSLSRSCKPCK